ncbi:hypothetical protein ACJX0J_027399, partial [Zea mays]
TTRATFNFFGFLCCDIIISVVDKRAYPTILALPQPHTTHSLLLCMPAFLNTELTILLRRPASQLDAGGLYQCRIIYTPDYTIFILKFRYMQRLKDGLHA